MSAKRKLDRRNTNFSLQLYEYFRTLAAKGSSLSSPPTEYAFLKYYQNIVREFMTGVDIDARGLLIKHEMGMGKSILAIAIAIDLIRERQPIILLTKSLQENMRSSIVKYVKLRAHVEPMYFLARMSDTELAAWIAENFSFVSMNASNMLKQMNNAAEGSVAEEFDAVMEKKFGEVLRLSSLDNKLLVVDEAHNFFRAITNGSKNALGLYEMIMRSKNLTICFLTGTPIANDPFELVPCFNMLGSRTGVPILPEHYFDFKKMFIDGKTIKNRGKFQNRLFGLVSAVNHTHTIGKALGLSVKITTEFPEELPTIVEYVPMDNDQYVIYGLARDREKEEGSKYGGPGGSAEPRSMTKPKSGASSTYRVHSRQLSNFCAPDGFRDEHDPSKIPVQHLGSAKGRRIVENINKHKDQLGIVYSQFVGVGGLGTFSLYLESIGWERVVLAKQIAGSCEECGGSKMMAKNSIVGSRQTDGYTSHIPTADEYLLQIESNSTPNSESNWWLGGSDDGMDTEAEVPIPDTNYLDNDTDGTIDLVEDATDNQEIILKETKKLIDKIKHTPQNTKKKFAVISGEVDVYDRARVQALFNTDDNAHGGICDLILLSSTGAEGLDLKNVRHIHIMEPYWNLGRLLQIIARGVRNDSHIALPANEKNVQPYVYLAVPPPDRTNEDGANIATTDMELYTESITGQVIIEVFNQALEEVSIECMVNDGTCRKCSPTDEPLFTNDIVRDMRTMDPCQQIEEKEIEAKSVKYDGVEYYYTPNSSNIYDYDIFEYDKTIDGYRPMPLSSKLYKLIVEEIKAIHE